MFRLLVFCHTKFFFFRQKSQNLTHILWKNMQEIRFDSHMDVTTYVRMYVRTIHSKYN